MILAEKYTNLTKTRVFGRFNCLDFGEMIQKVPKHMISAEKYTNLTKARVSADLTIWPLT